MSEQDTRYTDTAARVEGRRGPRSPKAGRHTCPAGEQCCLNALVKHDLHICGRDACVCHSQARYAPREDSAA